MLTQEIQQRVDTWLNGNFDQETKSEIQRMIDDNDIDTLNDGFYKDLEFGTGGMRGIMGVGTNRVNKYTIGMATQGLANYLKKAFSGKIKVAIAYDSRNNSDTLAQVVANVFSANDIEVYFFEALRPTPELSYVIRHLGCQSGVVLTASHNPKEYNGYKAYWDDGAQLVAPHDQNVIEEIKAISIDDVLFEPNGELIQLIGEDMDRHYLDQLAALSISKDAIQKHHDLKIVYTPLHGTGVVLIPKLLEQMGFDQVTVLEEQAQPDGNFPTVVYPNPEEAEALSLALAKAEETNADLVLATDPDTDRVGIAIKNLKGDFQLLNGNQTGVLLFYYLLEAWQKAGKLQGKEYVVKTIVTTHLMDTIAKAYGVECFNTLTGFKYIASIMRELEGQKTFIAGAEESYGYLIGDEVRDKDAVAAAGFIAEMLAFSKASGRSLFEMLVEIYVAYGFYYETLFSVKRTGMNGAKEIKEMMQSLRNDPPKKLYGSDVIQMIDYLSLQDHNLQDHTSAPLEGFDASNVLQFFTADGSKISVRPSGTEPKIKFYVSVKEDLDSKDQYESVFQKLKDKAAKIQEELGQ